MARYEHDLQRRRAHWLLLDFWIAYIEMRIPLPDDLLKHLDEYRHEWGENWPHTTEDVRKS